MIGQTGARALLERTLSFSRAGECEAVLMGLEAQLTRFANNGIHQHVAETNRHVVVRVALGKRVGAGATNDLTDSGLERAVEKATAAAGLLPEDPGFPGLPRPAAVPEVAAYDEATARTTPAERAQPVHAICRQAEEKGCTAAGAFRTAVHEYGVANSHGLFVYHPVTEADATVAAMAPGDGSGHAADVSWRVAEVDPVALGREAIDKALRSRHPQPVEPGTYPVVLEPYAAHDLLRTLATAAGARFVQEGRSWLSGRQGKRLMSPLVSIRDDSAASAWPLPIDFEGTARRGVDLVRGGVAGEPVYDRAQAALANEESSGHALPVVNPHSPWLDATRYGPVPLHTSLEVGETRIEDMIAGMEQGLYVTRFWYTRTVHPREAVVTGMTRDGTFLVERGEVTRPVRNLRFTQSYVEALAGVEAVGNTARRVWGDPGVYSAPALRLAAFGFTS